MSKWNYDRPILPHENETTKQRLEDQQDELKRVLNDKEPSNKKPNYKLVAGKPVCSLEECYYYRNYYGDQNPLYKPGKIHRCQASGFESVTKHILCIPGLREQRDDLKEENEQLKEELARLKPSDVCFICGGVGVVSHYDAYNGGHLEKCSACNGRREERERENSN